MDALQMISLEVWNSTTFSSFESKWKVKKEIEFQVIDIVINFIYVEFYQEGDIWVCVEWVRTDGNLSIHLNWNFD